MGVSNLQKAQEKPELRVEVVNEKKEIPCKEPKQKKNQARGAPKGYIVATDLNPDEVDLDGLVEEYFDGAFTLMEPIFGDNLKDGIGYRCERKSTSYCEIHRREHQHDNGFIIHNLKGVYFYCYRNSHDGFITLKRFVSRAVRAGRSKGRKTLNPFAD